MVSPSYVSSFSCLADRYGLPTKSNPATAVAIVEKAWKVGSKTTPQRS